MDFNPRPPCGGRLRISAAASEYHRISIHVPRVEDDIDICPMCVLKFGFQSTSPVWRTTDGYEIAFESSPISIHVPRVEDDLTVQFYYLHKFISIHVPRVEDDRDYVSVGILRLLISIHVPRVEDDKTETARRWRERWISIHVPRVEDDITSPTWDAVQNKISIHVPRVEDDLATPANTVWSSRFQSTSPVWRTTYAIAKYNGMVWISIHVPRVEDDAK